MSESARSRWIALAFLVIAIAIGPAACGNPGDPFVPPPGAGDVTIGGRVLAENGEPLSGVEVLLTPLSLTTVTAGDGTFRFLIPDPGMNLVYLIEVNHGGYERVTRGIGVPRGGVAFVNVTLERTPPQPAPEEPAPESSQGILVDSFSEDAVGCIAPGTILEYTVTIANGGDGSSPAVVLHDTLDATFGRALTSADIALNHATFPDAAVTLDPGGRSFEVELGSVPIMPATEVYTVRLPVGPAVGVHCNSVSAVDPEGRVLSDATSCVANTLAIEVDLVNEDGAIVGGAFTPDPEVFHVGDGGPDRPDALVYRVVVANHHCFALGFPLGAMSLTSIVGSRSGAVEFREALPGFPSRGSIVSSSPGGFDWSIGTLAPGEEAEVRFRAEAIAAGEDIHRIVLSVPQLTGVKVHEEPITILP